MAVVSTLPSADWYPEMDDASTVTKMSEAGVDTAGVVLCLRANEEIEESRLGQWVRELARVDGRPLYLALPPAVSRSTATSLVPAGITILVTTDSRRAADDVLVYADSNDVPAPSSISRLVAAVTAGEPLVAARPLPFAGVGEAGEVAPLVEASPVCVAASAASYPAVTYAMSAADLVRIAAASVSVLDSAAVFHDQRFESAEDTSSARFQDPDLLTGPLPATAIGQLLGRVGITAEQAQSQPGRPFLSVVTRTQGSRLQCLEEVLTCLAGQTSRDFELLLACHRIEDDRLESVRAACAATPEWLQQRTRVLTITREGRSAPLNDALDVAQGRYFAVLDDDDTVTSRWVETFSRLEAQGAGTVLRSTAARQEVEALEMVADGDRPVVVPHPIGPAHPWWPSEFVLADHLVDNASPCMTLAFPRWLFDDLGFRYDEDLSTLEDWEFLMRAAVVVGVTASPEVTGIYRVWVTGEGSRHLHDDATWAADRKRVIDRLDATPIILAPGDFAPLREVHQDRLADSAERQRLVDECARATEEATSLRAAYAEAIEAHDRAVEAHDRAVEAHDRAVAGRDTALTSLEEARAKIAKLRSRLNQQHQNGEELMRRVETLEVQLAETQARSWRRRKPSGA